MHASLRTRPRLSTVALGCAIVVALVTGVTADAWAGASACLLRSQYEPCALLKEDLVRKALGETAAHGLEQKSYSAKPRPPSAKPSRLPPSNISSCSYSWPSAMKRSVKMPGNKTMEIPRKAEVFLAGIVEYPENPRVVFERTHRTPTADEQAMLNERIDEGLAKAKAEGKVTESGRNVGKSLAKQALDGIEYTEVPGVGDAARWESKSAQLSVLVGAVKFDVSAMVGEDAAKNERVAVAIAKALIEACD